MPEMQESSMRCPGNPAVCKAFLQPKIPHCSIPLADNSECSECDEGYSLSANNKACIKSTCPSECSSCSKPSFCASCWPGYGLVKGKCLPCTESCWECSGPKLTCKVCDSGWGLNGGKCTPCPLYSYTCDKGKFVCYDGYGRFGATAVNPCTKCAVTDCKVCNTSACDKCSPNFVYADGKCNAPLT
jgi:hypothetical protein